MEKFISLKGTAVPLLVKNIDTDQIIPKQFLTTVKREGLSKGLFYDWRFDEDGLPQEEFVLNQKKYHNACVLLADDNFGCGSSREHAPWALLDFGIRCVIAPSFADIFANNCKKNGILTIKMSIEKINALLAATKQND
ncbi:MAG: 3-isopropylmalate/(R)-2-methylmalate dehydratase small subunit, partial [bacterium]